MKEKLLIIDDDLGTVDVCKLVFEYEGYQIETLEDGYTILNNTFDHLDIRLIDQMLHSTDGLAVCRHLKDGEATRDIPIIMLSATLDIVEQAAEVGANASIEKPFALAHLTQVVEY